MNKKLAIGIGAAAALGIIAYFIFSGGASENAILKIIPEKATAIVKIDFRKISKWFDGSKKDDFNDLKKAMGITDKTAEALSRVVDAIIKDPQSSGIDFSTPSYLFIHKTEKSNVIGWAFGLSEKKSWERMVKDKSPVGTLVEKIRDVDYAEMETGSYFSWTSNVLLYTLQPSESRDYFVELLETRKYEPRTESLVANVSKLKCEIGGAINFRWLMSGIIQNPKTQLIADEMPKDMAVLFNSSADKGKFTIESELINTNSEALEKISLIKSSTQGNEALASIPKNYDAYFAMNFGIDFQKMHQLKLDFFEDLLNLENRKESEEIEKCLTGDISLFVFDNTNRINNDTSPQKKNYNYGVSPFYFPSSEFVIVQGLAKNYDAYEKSINREFTIDGNIYTSDFNFTHLTFKSGKTYLSMNKNFIKEISGFTGTGGTENATLKKLLGTGNFIYFNPEKMYKSLGNSDQISGDARTRLKLLENRSKFIITASGKEKKSIIEVLFNNNSENGFKQLLISLQSFAEFGSIIDDELDSRKNYRSPYSNYNNLDFEAAPSIDNYN